MPSPDNDNKPKGGVTPTLYPARFVFDDDDEPLKETWIYTDVPGKKKKEFILQNRWQTSDTGLTGKLLENTDYNFYYNKKQYEKAYIERNVTEDHCTKVTTGAAKDGVIEIRIKRPKFEIEINGSAKPEAHYLGWAPSPGVLKQTVEDAPASEVILKYKLARNSAKLLFRMGLNKLGKDFMTVQVPAGKQEIKFFVGGKHGWPSQVRSSDTPSPANRDDDKDTIIEVRCNGFTVAELPTFVRVRKNANTLTPEERNRFLNTLGELKNKSDFKKIVEMHNTKVQGLIHGGPSFLPWHRAYLLDLEREMRKVDPTASLHYWDFEQESWDDSGDKVALFTENFLGKIHKVKGTWKVTFASSNPLSSAKHNWGSISRMPTWDPSNTTKGGVTKPPGWGASDPLKTQAMVVALSTERSIEGNPHNPAHAKMMGDLGGVNTAPKDPLFFMLHSNVDRLWAEWQAKHDAWDEASNSHFSQGSDRSGTSWSSIDGHGLQHTMWPWDGKTGSGKGHYDRPPSKPPGSGMPESPVTQAPEKNAVTLGDMLDYQGRKDPAKRLDMDYDSIGFPTGR